MAADTMYTLVELIQHLQEVVADGDIDPNQPIMWQYQAFERCPDDISITRAVFARWRRLWVEVQKSDFFGIKDDRNNVEPRPHRTRE
jgi:hypothetical protein